MAGNKNSGRAKKIEEIEMIEKLSPLDDLAFQKLKKGIEENDFRYIRLYFLFRYGKPRQQKEINLTTDKDMPLFNIKWVTSEHQENQ